MKTHSAITRWIGADCRLRRAGLCLLLAAVLLTAVPGPGALAQETPEEPLFIQSADEDCSTGMIYSKDGVEQTYQQNNTFAGQGKTGQDRYTFQTALVQADTYYYTATITVSKANQYWAGAQLIVRSGSNEKGALGDLFFVLRSDGAYLFGTNAGKTYTLASNAAIRRSLAQSYRITVQSSPDSVSVWVNTVPVFDKADLVSEEGVDFSGLPAAPALRLAYGESADQDSVMSVASLRLWKMGSRSGTTNAPASGGEYRTMFLSDTPPQPPEGNQNLITTSSELVDSSKGLVGVTYNKITNVLSNTAEDQLAFIRFADIQGLTPDDTYIYRFKLTTLSVRPSEQYNDYTSMGARIIYRGNSDSTQENAIMKKVITKDYAMFSMFTSSLSVYSYLGNQPNDSVYIPFQRELMRTYDVVILSGPTEASVWVDGKLAVYKDNLPHYDPYIGLNIYRARIEMKDIGVYNAEPDSTVYTAVDSSVKPMQLTYHPLDGVTPYSFSDSAYLKSLILGGGMAAISLVLLAVVVIRLIRCRRKRAEKKEDLT